MELQVNPDVESRIIAAIEQVYDELGRGDQYPAVSVVRNRARADMNSVSAVVKDWKRRQTARPAPVAVSVPEMVKDAHLEAVAIVWTAAQAQATASLQAAEVQWSLERAESETMRRELAIEFDAAVDDAEQSRLALSEVKAERDNFSHQVYELNRQLSETREALAQQTSRADEVERRASDLKEQLTIAHSDISSARDELTQARLIHLKEMDEFKSASAEQIAQLSENLAASRARLEDANATISTNKSSLAEYQARITLLDEKLSQQMTLHQDAVSELASVRVKADEAVREAAILSGAMQETKRQNEDLLGRLTPKRSPK
ncbi:Chromosome partition protein Smc [Pseudomonas fluorescens]|uniref:DNA-binding protein n=1 Tax=Pseudomonas fluorescens TaxID=294 RepID=UPI001241094F|nr:DNA-binding protein [Pseudomonas fluorescens]VVN30434.1 Chromosome partition protein Smc [Pseudomonas fluorescens]